MPLPFTNIWDQTFPADSALVSQGASNLRQLRLDVQQRMAAISGLDAAKPNFQADAQAAQWAGILFFATDTIKVYQFTGSTWIDVTSSIGSGGGGGGGTVTSPVLDRNTISITQSNSTSETNIFTTNVPALSATAILRVRMNMAIDAWAAPFNVIWRWNGGQIFSASFSSGVGGTVVGSELFIANRTVTNAQQWNAYFTTGVDQVEGGSGGAFVGEMAINTSVPTVLTCSVLDSAGGNTQTFNLWLVESL